MSEELLVEFNEMIPKKDEIHPPKQNKYIYLVFSAIISIISGLGFGLGWFDNKIIGIVFIIVSIIIFSVYIFINNKTLQNKFNKHFIEILKKINIADHEYYLKEEQVDGIRSIYHIEMKPDYKKNEYYLIIHTLQPGSLIGRRGANIKKLQKFLAYDFGYEPRIEFEEPTIFKNIYKR